MKKLIEITDGMCREVEYFRDRRYLLGFSEALRVLLTMGIEVARREYGIERRMEKMGAGVRGSEVVEIGDVDDVKDSEGSDGGTQEECGEAGEG